MGDVLELPCAAMFGAFLPVLAATDAAQAGGDDGKARSGVSAFPCEEPSEKPSEVTRVGLGQEPV